eukprot:scaffold42115_cov31-Tisochrysis_lutea.AAC.4
MLPLSIWRNWGATSASMSPIPSMIDPPSLRISNQTWLGAPCPASARRIDPQALMLTTAPTRVSCAAHSAPRPPPYETPAIAIFPVSAPQVDARENTVSTTLPQSASSAAPAAEMVPPDSHQPRATYMRTTYPREAHSSCLSAYSHQFINHELARITTGNSPAVFVPGAAGKATTAFS